MIDGTYQTGTIPSMFSGATVAISVVEIEIEDRPENVDLDLVILTSIPVRINEDLEIMFVIDDEIPFLICRPEIGLLHLDPHIKIAVVPEHLHSRFKAGLRQFRALNIAVVF